MNKVIIVLFLFYTSSLYSQKFKEYESEFGDYKINLPINSTFQSSKITNGIKDDFSIYNDKNEVRYLLNVIRIKGITDKYDFLLSAAYKSNYLKTCDCQILEIKEMRFSKYKGVKFYYKIENGTNTFYGNFISFIKDGSLLTITYNTVQRNFKLFEPEFNSILETLVVK